MRKLNTILIIFLSLVILSSISTAFAVDDNGDNILNFNQDGELKVAGTNDTFSVSGDLSNNILNEEDLSENENDTVSAENTVKSISFTSLKNEIKANTNIVLEYDVEYTSDDAGIKEGIVISKNLVIDGKGHTIDAKNTARVFKVASGKTLTLKNINFINARSSSSGGAILNSGTIKVSNCNFTNCHVTGSGSNGGAISGGGSGTIEKCIFNKCSAKSYGGAAHVKKIVFKYCNFTNNKAANGGALGGTVYIYNSYFENCVATATANKKSDDYGGGACNGEITRVESSVFVNCKAPNGYGGALRGTTNAYNCEFDDCSSKQGGAIRGKGITQGCTFKNCVATETMGGAIFTEKATINKCDFIGCSASKSNAGAVFTGNNVKITNCNFISCKASKGFGGAVYGNGVVSKCTFEKNHAKAGGAVSSYSLTVKSSKFISNTAGKGGAAYNVKSLSSCSFNKNSATYGGAIYNGQQVTSSKFVDNSAKNGAVSYNDVNVVFTKVNIKNSIKIINGLFYNKKHRLTLTSSEIVNTAKFSKFNYNDGVFIYTKNKIKSTPKVKKIAAPRNVQSK